VTTLEARVAALENDVLLICAVIREISAGQTLFASVATMQLQSLCDGVKRLRDDIVGDDDFDLFAGF
jgi:hypothetical protein